MEKKRSDKRVENGYYLYYIQHEVRVRCRMATETKSSEVWSVTVSVLHVVRRQGQVDSGRIYVARDLRDSHRCHSPHITHDSFGDYLFN